MKGLEEAKKKYDEIIIPEELSDRVRQAVARAGAPQGGIAETDEPAAYLPEKASSGRSRKQRTRRTGVLVRLRGAAAAAVAALVLLTAVLNTDTAMAEGLRGLPGIGGLARVLTFRSYLKEEEDMKLSVEIPSIEMIAGDTGGLADSVNQEIYEICQNYAAEAVERAREYRKAFLDTGGTQKEWEDHHIEIKVWYEIKNQTDAYLSLAVMGSENWTSSGSRKTYYNIDLKNGSIVTLKDLLGEDYVRIADESIREQMEAREKTQGTGFWTPDQGGFTGITDNTPFYINEAGNPVIVFDKYEIAPGSAGSPEFEIKP